MRAGEDGRGWSGMADTGLADVVGDTRPRGHLTRETPAAERSHLGQHDSPTKGRMRDTARLDVMLE